MNKALDVHTAELITAAVEVKTLTIRGKQVTLAVFRQLEETPLLLDDGSLAGIPWGRVNYHPDKCADTGKHMHVVWQQGTELRRARVNVDREYGTFWPVDDGYVSRRYALHQVGGVKNDFWEIRLAEWSGKRNYQDVTFTLVESTKVEIGIEVEEPAVDLPRLPAIQNYQRYADELTKLLALDPAEDEADRAIEQVRYDEYLDYTNRRTYAGRPRSPLDDRIAGARLGCAVAIEEAHAAAMALHKYLFDGDRLSLDQARSALLAEVAAEEARRQRICSSTAMLGELSQLFIAV